METLNALPNTMFNIIKRVINIDVKVIDAAPYVAATYVAGVYTLFALTLLTPLVPKKRIPKHIGVLAMLASGTYLYKENVLDNVTVIDDEDDDIVIDDF